MMGINAPTETIASEMKAVEDEMKCDETRKLQTHEQSLYKMVSVSVDV